MIIEKKVNICIGNDSYMDENLNLALYRNVMQFIKKLICIQPNEKCKKCSLKESCHYYKLSGDNFTNYPALLVDSEVFTNRRIKANEKIDISFYFIGKYTAFSEYIDFYFQSHHIIDNVHYKVIKIEQKQLAEEYEELKSYLVETPIETPSVINSYNSQIDYYNNHYGTSFEVIEGNSEMMRSVDVYMNHLCLGEELRSLKGVCGVCYSSELRLDLRIKRIGIGRFNYLGGGKIAVKD